ncbi:hypothetical protein TNCV_1956171 [Trichonephila clavipes]|nr:hypothetical protein TNCV_1956171 [Trichonephila clavipes]
MLRKAVHRKDRSSERRIYTSGAINAVVDGSHCCSNFYLNKVPDPIIRSGDIRLSGETGNLGFALNPEAESFPPVLPTPPQVDSDSLSKLILTLHCSATRGLLATDHVILNHGQVTWTTPNLEPSSPNYHTTPT